MIINHHPIASFPTYLRVIIHPNRNIAFFSLNSKTSEYFFDATTVINKYGKGKGYFIPLAFLHPFHDTPPKLWTGPMKGRGFNLLFFTKE